MDRYPKGSLSPELSLLRRILVQLIGEQAERLKEAGYAEVEAIIVDEIAKLCHQYQQGKR